MLLYNITFNIETRFHEQWLRWVKSHLISDFQKTNLIQNIKILKLLTEVNNGGTTYSLQIHFKDMETYKIYESTYKDYILDRHNSLFRGKFVTFTTLLEEI